MICHCILYGDYMSDILLHVLLYISTYIFTGGSLPWAHQIMGGGVARRLVAYCRREYSNRGVSEYLVTAVVLVCIMSDPDSGGCLYSKHDREYFEYAGIWGSIGLSGIWGSIGLSGIWGSTLSGLFLPGEEQFFPGEEHVLSRSNTK